MTLSETLVSAAMKNPVPMLVAGGIGVYALTQLGKRKVSGFGSSLVWLGVGGILVYYLMSKEKGAALRVLPERAGVALVPAGGLTTSDREALLSRLKRYRGEDGGVDDVLSFN